MNNYHVPINLNIEDWSRLDQPSDYRAQTFKQDIVSTLESISYANILDSLCDHSDREYIS